MNHVLWVFNPEKREHQRDTRPIDAAHAGGQQAKVPVCDAVFWRGFRRLCAFVLDAVGKLQERSQFFAASSRR